MSDQPPKVTPFQAELIRMVTVEAKGSHPASVITDLSATIGFVFGMIAEFKARHPNAPPILTGHQMAELVRENIASGQEGYFYMREKELERASREPRH